MTPEDPTTQTARSAEEIEQQQIINEVYEYLGSDYAEDNFLGIEIIQQITKPEERAPFEYRAYEIIFDFLDLNKPSDISEASIKNALKAINHMHYLRGIYGKNAIKKSSETYEKLLEFFRADQNNPFLRKFFEEVDKN